MTCVHIYSSPYFASSYNLRPLLFFKMATQNLPFHLDCDVGTPPIKVSGLCFLPWKLDSPVTMTEVM